MKDGHIEIDSENGKIFGFTSDLFEGYLWKKENDIYISFIISIHEGKGNLRKCRSPRKSEDKLSKGKS